MAAPASAHELTNVVLTTTCNSAGKICVDVTGTIKDGMDKRIVTLDLLGQNGTATPTKLDEKTISIPANHTGQDVQFDSGQICFGAVTGTFDHFLIKWVSVTDDQGNPADLAITLTDASGQQVTFTQKDLPAILVPNIKPCTSPPPSPSAPAPSPTANTTAVLAQTGGFDYRFPLIGLAVIVAGLALFLVSSSRARRSTGQK